MSDFRAAVLSLGMLGCEPAPVEIPGPSYSEFRDAVYPHLLRDCGFIQCHGDPDRFFTIYGPGRTRLDPATEIFDPPTEDELRFAYENSRGMLASDRGVLDSPLLTKPREGHGHGGLDHFGRNVWQSDDPVWSVLSHWLRGVP